MSSIFEEIAFEPSAFESARDLRDVHIAFGFAQGRLVSALPANWVKRVYDRIAELPDMEGKRARDLLRAVQNGALVSAGFTYSGSEPWDVNALRALQDRKVNGAVVSRHTVGRLPNIDSYFDSIEPRHACQIRTTLDEYRSVCRRLVERGPRVVLVDPYFHVVEVGKAELLLMLLNLGTGGACHDFDVLLSASEVDKKLGLDRFERSTRKALESRIPPRASVEFFLVDELENGRLHDRFLITEHGGISVGVGFRIDKEPVRTTVSTLSAGVHRQLCELYLDRPLGPALKVVRTAIVKGRER